MSRLRSEGPRPLKPKDSGPFRVFWVLGWDVLAANCSRAGGLQNVKLSKQTHNRTQYCASRWGLEGLSGLSLTLKRTSSNYSKVRTLARILSFYVETIFELIRVSNKVEQRVEG